MKILKKVDENLIVEDYTNGMTIMKICEKYKIGKKRIKQILSDNNVVLRTGHEIKIQRNFVIPDFHIKKYENGDNYFYVAIAKDSGIEFNDIENHGGHLTSYIRNNLGISQPTLYERRIYYQTTGNYWWEQWFNVEKRFKKTVKKCPYCNWETIDIENKSGAFEVHLKEVHNITKEEYLKEFPEDIEYFSKYKKKIEHENKLKKKENFVYCPICGEKYEKLTPSHLKTHDLTMEEFKERYPDSEVMSVSMVQQSRDCAKLGNLNVSKNRFISKYEREIQEFLLKNNIKFETNRQILIGKEIDILVPDLKIGIEFDGLKWHTEWFGKKKHNYHLDKTIACNEKGYGLVHIFEDEYVNNKEIVYHKLSRILHLDENLPNIMGRKCIVKEIYKIDAETFLKKFHIQGFSSASVYLGCYYNDLLIGVMCFKNGNIRNDCWELTRFATDYNYNCQGVGGKMFSYFIKKYQPEKIISFADRRWTVNPNKNLYTNLGFILEKFNPPDYKYYSDESKNNQKYNRIHKMQLNKQKLHKKYGLPLTMTETEMAKELGYDRIWDCGLIKYVWKKEETES